MSQTRRAIAMTAAMGSIAFVAYWFYLLSIGVSPTAGLPWAASLGVTIALLLAIYFAVSASFHRQAVSGKKQAGDTLDMHQQRTVEIDLPYDSAFELALAVLKTMDNQYTYVPVQRLAWLRRLMRNKMKLRIHQIERETGTILAGLREYSFGMVEFFDTSRIHLRLEKIDAGTTRIHIESRHVNLLKIYDMGVNLHNVNHLALYLRRESQQQTAASRLSENDVPDAEEDFDAESEMNRGQENR